MVVHGEQNLEIYNPLPRNATIATTAVIEGIYDKGSGALIVMRLDTKDKSGTPLCSNWIGIFVRGAGALPGRLSRRRIFLRSPPKIRISSSKPERR